MGFVYYRPVPWCLWRAGRLPQVNAGSMTVAKRRPSAALSRLSIFAVRVRRDQPGIRAFHRPTIDRPADRLGVRIKHHLRFVEPVSRRRIPRHRRTRYPYNWFGQYACACSRAKPCVRAAPGSWIRSELLLVLWPSGTGTGQSWVACSEKDREVDAGAIPSCAKRIRTAWTDLHGSLVCFNYNIRALPFTLAPCGLCPPHIG